MVKLIAKTPLGGTAPIERRFGNITLAEITDRALASVAARAGDEEKTRKSMAQVLGGPLPGVGLATQKGDFGAFWMGPDQWMIEAPIETHEELASLLGAKSEGAFSVTEQSGAWCRFDLQGQELDAVFERLCPVNTRAFTSREAVRTSIHHIGCFVIRRSAKCTSVMGPRSFADALLHALETAVISAQAHHG